MLRGGQDAAFRREEISRISKEPHGFILTNPETLSFPNVLTMLSSLSISHIVIDEVQTVTQWGKTFHPAYLPLGNLIHVLNTRIITAFKATASPGLIPRLKQLLFKTDDVHVIRGNPDRHLSSVPPVIVRNVQLNCFFIAIRRKKSGIIMRDCQQKRKKGLEGNSRLLPAMLSRTKCRREALLAMLDAHPETCSGCDVCASDVWELSASESVIREAVIHSVRSQARESRAFVQDA